MNGQTKTLPDKGDNYMKWTASEDLEKKKLPSAGEGLLIMHVYKTSRSHSLRNLHGALLVLELDLEDMDDL